MSFGVLIYLALGAFHAFSWRNGERTSALLLSLITLFWPLLWVGMVGLWITLTLCDLVKWLDKKSL